MSRYICKCIYGEKCPASDPPITPTPTDLDTIDDAIFNIEDYIGGNIEGVEKIDRMGLTVFLRTTLTHLIQAEIVKARIEELEKVGCCDYWEDGCSLNVCNGEQLDRIAALKEGLKK